jgi:hypothetical protein
LADNASERIAGYAVAVTVTIIFTVIWFVAPFLQNIENSFKAAASALGVLGSAATYRAVVAFLWRLFRRNLWIRRWVLGRVFLEGTWVGHYVRGTQHIVTVEFYDQESGEIKIEGQEIDAGGNTLSDWESYAASLNYAGDVVIYAYECDVFARGGKHAGIARFRLVRADKRSKPDRLDGYSADLTDGQKDPNYEYKISDYRMDKVPALAKAREKFKF